MEGSGNFDHLGLFKVHLNVSTRASDIFASIENATAAASIEPATSGPAAENRVQLYHHSGYSIHASLSRYQFAK